MSRPPPRPAPGGAPTSADLLPSVYAELRRLAAWQMARETPGQTLQATALVHEAWLRLAGTEPGRWQNRAHFLGAAAEAMRRILVENARRKRQLKRGGHWERVPLAGIELPAASPEDRILLVNEALAALSEVDPVEARVVQLRFFGGLTYAEIGQLLGLSERTVKRYWQYAKVWLYERICAAQAAPDRADSPAPGPTA